MKRMTPQTLKKLENIQNNIQITIYLPLLPGPQNTAKNVSALHHATALLHKTFTDEEVSPASQKLAIEHIRNLEQELSHSMKGGSLAVFITDSNDMLAYQVPFEIESAIFFMAPNMNLEPLKSHYRESAVYWVLSLSQKGCTLFKGSNDRLVQVEATDISIDMKTALGLDEVNNAELQVHSVSGGNRHMTEGFHGHGGFKDLKKKYLENYLRQIDAKLDKHLHNNLSPVILVGVDYTQKQFERLTKHRHIMTTNVTVNHPESVATISFAIQPLVLNLATVSV